jgi:hypothetical protein
MPNHYVCRRIASAMADVPTLAGVTAQQAAVVIATLLVTLASVAQTPPNQSQIPVNASADSQRSAPATAATVTVPAGTEFALVLTSPLASKNTHRGDTIHAETTAPITVGDQVVIPAGTFIQGQVDRLSRNGSRAQMVVKSASVVFPDGYVANISGTLNVESDEGTAWRDPSDKAKVGALIAPAAGVGIGALIGSQIHTTQSSTLGGTTITSSTPKGIAIGSGLGLAAGAAVSLALLLHSRGFFVDVGSPMEMTLPQPLMLSENQADDSIRWVREHPVAAPMASPRPLPLPPYDRGICYTPGTPGTPPTIIPGTPAIGDNPGTPSTVIPGTPAVPGSPYPCP